MAHIFCFALLSLGFPNLKVEIIIRVSAIVSTFKAVCTSLSLLRRISHGHIHIPAYMSLFRPSYVTIPSCAGKAEGLLAKHIVRDSITEEGEMSIRRQLA